MHAPLAPRLTALAVALTANCSMIGGVAYLLFGQVHAMGALQTLARTVALAVPAV